jgi:hypothetical protein
MVQKIIEVAPKANECLIKCRDQPAGWSHDWCMNNCK